MNYTIDYNYLRPKKAEYLKKWYSLSFEERNDLKVYQYTNATILPLKKFSGDNLLFGRGGVVDENGNYVEQSAIEGRIQESYQITETENSNEKVVYCGYLVNHWGHFLTEAVSRLWYFMKNDVSVDKYVFFINENEERRIKGNYKEFFELLGIWNKLEIINKPTCYKEVIVPELCYKGRKYYSQEFKDIFETIAKNINVNPTWKEQEKIFLTRSQLKKSHQMEFGIEVLDSYFVNNGYKLISPEKISLSELIFLIRNAKKCASVSGTLPHNMLFAKDGQELIIMERLTMNNDFQVDFNRMKSFDVTYIDSNIAIYPVDFSGPSIIAYNGLMSNFTSDNAMTHPDQKYCKKQYYVKCFKKYMKTYRKKYGYQWYMLDWYIKYNHIGYIYEAYHDGMKYFGEYIRREKPVCFFQYFQLNYIKQIIKKLINK